MSVIREGSNEKRRYSTLKVSQASQVTTKSSAIDLRSNKRVPEK